MGKRNLFAIVLALAIFLVPSLAIGIPTHFLADPVDSNHYKWGDQDPGTPEIDVLYDFGLFYGFLPNLITPAQTALAEAAFDLWASASNLNFIRNVTAPYTDVITIGVGDLGPFGHFSEPGGTLAVGGGVLDSSNDSIGSGIVLLDMAESWDEATGNGNPAGTFDFFTVAAHEIGHALGLGHMDDIVGPDMMDGYYGGENTVLSANDAEHITFLYGSPSDGSGPTTTLVTTDTSTNPVPEPGTMLLLGSGLAGLGLWRKKKLIKGPKF